MTGEHIETVVIGAGVIGLAVGRALALAGQEVAVLECNDAIGMETSSRNSEVIHAGLYYPPGSLKAQCCVAGKQSLYQYCAERAIPHQRLGKLILARDDTEAEQLSALQQNARVNGVATATILACPE